jgi:multiple antibiotic resistance protein
LFSVSFLLTTFVSILAIVNPFTAMPVFLALTEKQTHRERNQQAMRGVIYMVMILLTFLFGGAYIISFFGISIEGIRIAGGLMIMRFAYSLLNPKEGGRKITSEDEEESRQKEDISFSPLAMPLLSGPGSIAVVLGFSSQAEAFGDYLVLTVAILLVATACFAVLRISPKLVKLLGKTGMTALTRMMGFIALCIGVQFIINGITMLLT